MNPINNEKEYQNAVERLELIFDSKKGTPESNELEILTNLISEYEDKYYPIGLPNTKLI